MAGTNITALNNLLQNVLKFKSGPWGKFQQLDKFHDEIRR